MIEEIWDKIQLEMAWLQEPMVQKLLKTYLTNSQNLADVVMGVLSHKLSDSILGQKDLSTLFKEILKNHLELKKKFAENLEAYYQRDFACQHYLEALLLFRGYQALSTYRFAHILYQEKQLLSAKYLQNRIFEKFAIDIHPAAKIGKGLGIDPGIGVVIGETCQIE